jgi:hypothetical protein
MSRYTETGPQSKPRTPAQTRVFAPLGLVTARAAHATPDRVVTRERFMLADEGGARVITENAPAFVWSSGRKVIAGRDASPGAIDALTRHAQRAEREQTPQPWQGRRAA